MPKNGKTIKRIRKDPQLTRHQVDTVNQLDLTYQFDDYKIRETGPIDLYSFGLYIGSVAPAGQFFITTNKL